MLEHNGGEGCSEREGGSWQRGSLGRKLSFVSFLAREISANCSDEEGGWRGREDGKGREEEGGREGSGRDGGGLRERAHRGSGRKAEGREERKGKKGKRVEK